MKSGFAVTVGRPSCGKSTLINTLCGHKVSIVSSVPQTTRRPVRGIANREEGQIVFSDTPGFHLSEKEFNRALNETTAAALRDDPDAVLYVLDATRMPGDEEEALAELLSQAGVFPVFALNKIDAVDKTKQDALSAEFKKAAKDVFLISAVTGENLDKLLDFMAVKVDEIEHHVSDIVVEEDLDAYNNDDSAFEVYKAAKDTYIVDGGKIKRLAAVTDARNTEQIIRLQNILTGMGVFDELKKQGVKDGDTIVIGHLEMEYWEDQMYS